MLQNTFCHLEGIGEKTERSLWAAGFTTWNSLLEPSQAISRRVKPAWTRPLLESRSQHALRNSTFFADNLPPNQQWRLFADFQDSAAFLDIETTGMSFSDEITTIALYDGQTIRHYVNGHNLPKFVQDVQDYRLLVSYNGKSFDVPFLERYFGIRLTQAHIDLRYVLASLGLRGGLKGCERKLGLHREELEGVDGFFAVLLWQEYHRRKDDKALETLLAYNIQDAVVLQTLMIHAFNEKVKQTPFSTSHSLPARPIPQVPFKAHRPTVEKLLRNEWGYSAASPSWSSRLAEARALLRSPLS